MPRSILFLSTLCLLTAVALAGTNRDAEILLRAQQLQLEYRQGNTQVVEPLVKSLEDAVARSPDNAALWAALGHAYMSMQGTIMGTGPDVPKMLAVGERAQQAYARSLALEGNNPLIRASHGMASLVVAQFKGDGPGMAAAVEEMNAAVRAAPKSHGPRLTRAFTIIHLPLAMRDTDAVIEDINFLLDTAPGGRAEDVLHVMLGDVHAEMGRPDAARAEYVQVNGDSAFAASQAKLRQADLEKGSIPPASIAMVRAGTGTRCAMCHAPGTDR